MYFRYDNQQGNPATGNMSSPNGMTQGTVPLTETYNQPSTPQFPAGATSFESVYPSDVLDTMDQPIESDEEQATQSQGGWGYVLFGTNPNDNTQGYGTPAEDMDMQTPAFGYPAVPYQTEQYAGQMGNPTVMNPTTAAMPQYQGMTAMPGMMFYCPMMYGMQYSPNMYSQQMPMQQQGMAAGANYTGSRQFNPLVPLLFYGLTQGLNPYHNHNYYYDDYHNHHDHDDYYDHHDSYYDDYDDHDDYYDDDYYDDYHNFRYFYDKE